MMQYDFLRLGKLEIPAKLFRRGAGERKIWVPVRAAVIRSGDQVILYDVGCSEGDRTGELPLEREREEYLLPQLAKLGLTPDRITAIVISHSHSDHFGGISLFADKKIPVYVPEENFRLHAKSAPELQYIPVSVGQECTIAAGVTILTLPGHTENLLGLLLSENGHSVLIQSDAAYTPAHLEKPMLYPEYTAGDALYASTIRRMRTMQQNGVEITWFHWPIAEGEL